MTPDKGSCLRSCCLASIPRLRDWLYRLFRPVRRLAQTAVGAQPGASREDFEVRPCQPL
jgi:hypothetical protein